MECSLSLHVSTWTGINSLEDDRSGNGEALGQRQSFPGPRFLPYYRARAESQEPMFRCIFDQL